MKRTFIIILTLILLVATAVLIFGFSAQTADESSGLSVQVARFFVAILTPDFGELSASAQRELIASVHGLVRKAAHFTEYAVLGLVLAAHLRAVLPELGILSVSGIAALLGAAYALFDEWHQFFVDGRDAQLLDVLIDSAGILCGVAVLGLFLYLGGRPRGGRTEKYYGEEP